MNYTLYIIRGGLLDGRVVLENNDTFYKIILATPTQKAKVGVSLLSYRDKVSNQPLVYELTNFKEQKKLIPHLLKQLKYLI